MGRTAALIVAVLVAANVLAEDAARVGKNQAGKNQAGENQAAEIQATTAAGEKVRLMPNGHWEYVDQKKAEPQRKAQAEEAERERSAQGGWFGIGRKIYPGDPDYNRGSLNPNKH